MLTNIKWIGIIFLMLVYHIPARAQDSLAIKERPAYSLMVGGHKSGYNDIHVSGASQSVNASLVNDDEYRTNPK